MRKATVLVVRHEVHGTDGMPSNALAQQYRERAISSGQRLKKRGYVIDVALSSPQPRAIDTLICLMIGMGRVQKFAGISDAFGDSVLGDYPFTPEELGAIKTLAAERKTTAEDVMLTEAMFRSKLLCRGNEAGNALWEFLFKEKHSDVVYAVATHGGSRIEPMILELLGDGYILEDIPRFEPGDVAVLEFDLDRYLEEPKFVFLGNW